MRGSTSPPTRSSRSAASCSLTARADSLGYFATRRDKAVVFSADRRAAVTYRVEGTVCVASADPIGPVDAWPGAISAWLRECRSHAWYPTALSPASDGAEAYVDAGLRALGPR